MDPNEIATHRRRLVGSWCPQEPTPRQQTALEAMSKREMLYGGAAGGGKSSWLLMEALRYVHVPGYSAIIFRRTSPQLHQSDGLIPRSKEWLATSAAEWSVQHATWTFPSGATLKFAHLQYDNDKYDYQGGAFQFIGWDELTHFLESQYTYLWSRLRKPMDAKKALSSIPDRFRAASNPGGIGHDWVKQRFLIEQDPNRMFVPAKLGDNPYIDTEDYLQNLENLTPHELSQLRDGNWDARPPGAMFNRAWFQQIDTAPVHVSQRVRSWDIAATTPKPGTDPDYTVGTLMSRNEHADCTLEDVIRGRWSPAGVDQAMLSAAKTDPEGT